MKKPIVSVLMTVFNHQNYVKNSVKSILSQNFKRFEFILIDNGSTDNSTKIIKSFKDKRVKKIYLKNNIGRTKCLNYGLKHCRGKYIAVLDSDDVAKKNRINIQYKALENDSNLWLIGSNYNLINTSNKKIGQSNIDQNLNNRPRKIIFKNLIAHSTVMFRKKLLKKIGLYPKEFQYAQDYAFYLKTIKNFKIKILKEKLINLRVPHKNSETLRLYKTNIINLEEIRLLIWSLKNLKTNGLEKIMIILNIFIKYLKVFKNKFI